MGKYRGKAEVECGIALTAEVVPLNMLLHRYKCASASVYVHTCKSVRKHAGVPNGCVYGICMCARVSYGAFNICESDKRMKCFSHCFIPPRAEFQPAPSLFFFAFCNTVFFVSCFPQTAVMKTVFLSVVFVFYSTINVGKLGFFYSFLFSRQLCQSAMKKFGNFLLLGLAKPGKGDRSQ